MRNLIILISLFILFNSCDSKLDDPIFETFDSNISKCNKIVIAFIENEFVADKSQVFTITNFSEIKKLRDLIKQSAKSIDCYKLGGTIHFLSNSLEIGVLDFSLDNKCPSFYIYIEGKPVTYKMSYRCGMYLSELQSKMNK